MKKHKMGVRPLRLTGFVILTGVTALVAVAAGQYSLLMLPAAMVLTELMGIGYAALMMNSLELLYRAEADPEGGGIKGTCFIRNRSFLPVLKGCFRTSIENRTFPSKNRQLSFFSIPGRFGKTMHAYGGGFEVKGECCGKYLVQVDRILILDLLGIVCFDTDLKAEQEVCLYPRFVPVEGARIVMKPNYEKEKMFSGVKGEMLSDVLQYREYQMGDSLKRINWKLSARYDELMLREFDTPVDNRTLILMDLSQGEAVYLSLAIQMAASACMEYVRQGVSHVLGWYNEKTDSAELFRIESREDVFDALNALFEDLALTETGTIETMDRLHLLDPFAYVIRFTNMDAEKENSMSLSAAKVNSIRSNEQARRKLLDDKRLDIS